MSSSQQNCHFTELRRLPYSLTSVSLLVLALLSSGAVGQNLPNTPTPMPSKTAPLADTRTASVPSLSDTPSPSLPPNTSSAATPICGITRLGRCIRDLAEDDKGIFTSPLRVKPVDAYWLMPLGAATGLAFAYDTDAEAAEGYDKDRENTANTISDFGSFYASGAEGAALYFAGLARHNPKLAETGRLGAEAVIDSGTVTLATKLVTNRERPIEGDRQGSFWTNETGRWSWDSSFPLDHATASMAFASRTDVAGSPDDE